MRRLERIAAHVYGGPESPLWAQLMDRGATGRLVPRGGGCACTADKWRYVCQCYHCLDHVGRSSDFEWTTALVTPTKATASSLQPQSVASEQKGKGKGIPQAATAKGPAATASSDLATEEFGRSTRFTAQGGRIIGPLSPAVHPRFGDHPTFARLPRLEDVHASKASSGGSLRVRILSGHGLRNRDTGLLGDVSDPYVVARVGAAEQRTSVVNNSLDPVWSDGQELSFRLEEHNGALRLEVMNANYLKDDSLGTLELGLWALPTGRWQRRRVALSEGRGGEIEFEARLDRDVEPVDIAIKGVPFDSGCSFRPGARFGPESVRTNSRLIRPYMIAAQQRPFMQRQVADAGDVAATPFGIDKATAQIYEDCRATLGLAKRLVLIGGDHTLSYPAIKAVAEKFGPVVLVHFDSHLDTFPPMYGQDVWHGSPFRNCWDEGLLAKDGSTHIGIRATTYSDQDFADSDAMGIATLTAEDVHELGEQAVVDTIRQRCQQRAPGAPVYLSIDIDVLDPSVAPGTGTPEFGGLLAHQLLRIIRGLRGLPIVGADVVEVAPAYDHAGITAMAGAHILLEEIALMNSCMDTDGF